jgi:hypothetical protein
LSLPSTLDSLDYISIVTDSRKPPPPGKSESPRLSSSERRRKQKLLLKKQAATKKQAAITATAMASVKLLEANTEGNKSDKPSNTESEDVKEIVNSKAACCAAKIEEWKHLMEEQKEASITKEMEMLRLVETPVTSGPPKNQQAITQFFAREDALARKKVQDSVKRRMEKGLGWYSRMKKTPEEIKIMRFQMRQKMAEEKREAAASRAAKSCQKKEDEDKAQRQDAKDKKTALALYNKYYKDDFAKKLNRGKNAKRQKVAKDTKRLNRDFEITNLIE